MFENRGTTRRRLLACTFGLLAMLGGIAGTSSAARAADEGVLVFAAASLKNALDADYSRWAEDAVRLFSQTGITTVFTNLEGFPEDWRTNPEAFINFVREHQCPSFLEYGEYPYVTADEIKKALKLKSAFSDMLDQMQ